MSPPPGTQPFSPPAVSPLRQYELLVEDDNGRYFVVTVEAIATTDARRRVGYILDQENARIISVVAR